MLKRVFVVCSVSMALFLVAIMFSARFAAHVIEISLHANTELQYQQMKGPIMFPFEVAHK